MNVWLVLSSPVVFLALVLLAVAAAGALAEARARGAELGERETVADEWAAALWRREAALREREAALRWAGDAEAGR